MRPFEEEKLNVDVANCGKLKAWKSQQQNIKVEVDRALMCVNKRLEGFRIPSPSVLSRSKPIRDSFLRRRVSPCLREL
jgi:plastocyanin domain-containing protein